MYGGILMKRIIKSAALLLSLLLIFSCTALFGASAATGDYYFNTFNGYAILTGCRVTLSGEITIPETYDGYDVTHIGSGAFKDQSKITKVTLPASIVSVGSNAFDSCTALEKVVFNGTVCDIGSAAFIHCSNLKTIQLPSKLEEIPNEAFSDCTALTAIEIPSSVTLIGKEAFNMCEKLTMIEIPASVTTIRQNAFRGCSSVTAFSVESGNKVYCSVNGVLYGPLESSYDPNESSPVTDKALLQYPNAKSAASFTVPSDVLRIGNAAFSGNTTLTKVTLPNGLNSIESHAFFNCTALAEINIPSAATQIGQQAFGNCSSLKTVTVPASVEAFDYAFCASGLTSVVISDGVKEIGMGAFADCTNLRSVTVPASVTKIENGAFNNCNSVSLTVESGSYAETYAANNSIPYTIGAKKVASISVASLPSKLDYYYKESINTSGLSLTVNYSDGTSETVTGGFEVSPETFTKTGSQKVTVTYGGCTATFNVSVSYAWWQWIIRILLLGIFWY